MQERQSSTCVSLYLARPFEADRSCFYERLEVAQGQTQQHGESGIEPEAWNLDSESHLRPLCLGQSHLILLGLYFFYINERPDWLISKIPSNSGYILDYKEC